MQNSFLIHLLFPEEPLSLQHWLDSAGLAATAYGGYKMSGMVRSYYGNKRYLGSSRVSETLDDVEVQAKPVLSSSAKSWYKPDGTMNYPPNNGAVPGTEKIISLQPGDTLGRYGNIGNKSNFVTQAGTNANILSLPPTTDPSIYQEFVVLK